MSFFKRIKSNQPSIINDFNGIGKYVFEKTIGKGTFGKVKLGTHITTNEKVAIKILEKDKILEPEDLERLNREITILKKLNHQNIIKIYEIIENERNFYIIMEYANGGELFSYIVSKKRLSCEEASLFFVQIINGLEYIHKNKVVHRDMKPENLLLNENKIIKIIDFGLSNHYEGSQLLSTPCGSPCYAAPEMIQGKKYSGLSVDIWSTGIILYAIVCGFLPFEDKNNEKLYRKIVQCRLEFPKYLKDICVDMIKRILVVDPSKRISLEEIKKHKFYLEGEKQLNYEEKIDAAIRMKIEEKTINEMILIGFSKDEIEANLNKSKHNEITTTYDLLFQKFSKIEKKNNHDNKLKIDHEINLLKKPVSNSITPKEETYPSDKKQYENNINIQIKYEKHIGNININISEPNEISSKSNQPEFMEQFTFKEHIDENNKKKVEIESKNKMENERIVMEEIINKEKAKRNNFFVETSCNMDYNKIKSHNKLKKIDEEKISILPSKKLDSQYKSKLNKLDPFTNLTRNHNISPNNLEILLTEGLSISKNKDFRIFESLSPKKNNFIYNNKFISDYNSDTKNNKKKEPITKVNNPLCDSEEIKLNKQRQQIRENFISIKEKIQLIKDSVINEMKPNVNHVNIEKKNLLDNIVLGPQKDKITTRENKTKNNSKLIAKSKLLEMDKIKEELEMKKSNHKQKEIELEEKLYNLKNKIKNKNSLYEKFAEFNSYKNRDENIEKTKSKENKFNSIIDAMKKVRNVSTLDSIDGNDPTFKSFDFNSINNPISNGNIAKIQPFSLNLPDSLIDNTINSFSKHKHNFLNKFGNLSSFDSNEQEALYNNWNNLQGDKAVPNTTKNINNTNSILSSYLSINNPKRNLSNQRYNEITSLSSISPINEELKFKDNIRLPNNIKNISKSKNINKELILQLKNEENTNSKLDNLKKTDIIENNKFMSKLALLRKNQLSNDNNHLSKNKEENQSIVGDSSNVAPKEFACCAIYNNISIQDKLVKYCESQKIEVKKISSLKFECRKEGNTVGIEFSKIGHKGMSFMKMFHLSGNEKITKEIIKNLIINIGL